MKWFRTFYDRTEDSKSMCCVVEFLAWRVHKRVILEYGQYFVNSFELLFRTTKSINE